MLQLITICMSSGSQLAMSKRRFPIEVAT